MQKNYKISIIEPAYLEKRILLIRGQKVMFDNDLAELYQVSTKRLNEQIKRNRSRFPSDFMFQLTQKETRVLNRSQFATGSQKHRDLRFQPYVFTEHGVAMLSSVLRSQRAIQMNIFIIRAFVKLREIIASHKDLVRKFEELEREQREQGEQINEVYSIVKQLIDEPLKQKGRMGFSTDD